MSPKELDAFVLGVALGCIGSLVFAVVVSLIG